MDVSARGRLLIPFSLVLLLAAGLPTAHAQDPSPQAPEWIDATYRFDVSDNLRSVNLTGIVLVHEALATGDTRIFCQASCTADEMRILYWNTRPADRGELVEVFEDDIEKRAAAALARVAGSDEGVTVTADLDEASLDAETSGNPYHPAVVVDLVGFSPVGLIETSEYSQAQLRSILAMGTRMRVPLEDTVALGHNLTMTLAVQDPLELIEASNAELTEGDRAATWLVSNWQGAHPIRFEQSILVGRPDVEVPEAASGTLEITLDLSDVDANYGRLFSGSEMVTVNVALSVDGTYEAVDNDADLGAGAELAVLSADALRIGLDAGVIERGQLTDIERSARDGLRDALSGAFGNASTVEGGFLNSSLARDEVGSPPGSGPPILLRVTGTAQAALPPARPAPTGLNAFTIADVPLGDQLSIPDIPGAGTETVVLRIVLPPGTDLRYDAVEGGNVTREKDGGGHTVYVIRGTEPGEAPTIQRATLHIEHPLLVHLFWPILLLAGLVLVGIVLGIVLLVRRVVRGRRERVA